jgi:hypothetical protein
LAIFSVATGREVQETATVPNGADLQASFRSDVKTAAFHSAGTTAGATADATTGTAHDIGAGGRIEGSAASITPAAADIIITMITFRAASTISIIPVRTLALR